MKKVVAKARAR